MYYEGLLVNHDSEPSSCIHIRWGQCCAPTLSKVATMTLCAAVGSALIAVALQTQLFGVIGSPGSVGALAGGGVLTASAVWLLGMAIHQCYHGLKSRGVSKTSMGVATLSLIGMAAAAALLTLAFQTTWFGALGSPGASAALIGGGGLGTLSTFGVIATVKQMCSSRVNRPFFHDEELI